jgi:hypothetical protein
MINTESRATFLSLQHTQDRKIQCMRKERIPNWTPCICPVTTNRIPTGALAYITMVQRQWVPRKCLRLWCLPLRRDYNFNNKERFLSVKHTHIYCTYVLQGQHVSTHQIGIIRPPYTTTDLYLYIGARWWLFDELKHVACVACKYNKYRCVWLTKTCFYYWNVWEFNYPHVTVLGRDS